MLHEEQDEKEMKVRQVLISNLLLLQGTYCKEFERIITCNLTICDSIWYCLSIFKPLTVNIHWIARIAVKGRLLK